MRYPWTVFKRLWAVFVVVIVVPASGVSAEPQEQAGLTPEVISTVTRDTRSQAASFDPAIKAAVAELLSGTGVVMERSASRVQATKQNKHWIKRHPSAAGALIGSGVGFAGVFIPYCSALSGPHNPDVSCAFPGVPLGLLGAGIFAGIGALVGLAF